MSWWTAFARPGTPRSQFFDEVNRRAADMHSSRFGLSATTLPTTRLLSAMAEARLRAQKNGTLGAYHRRPI